MKKGKVPPSAVAIYPMSRFAKPSGIGFTDATHVKTYVK